MKGKQMKKLAHRLLLAALLSATLATSCFAGAWTAQQGAFYEKFSFNYYHADDSFNFSGSRTETPNNGRFTDYNVSNYFEYGLLDNLTAINSLTYKWLRNETDSTITRGYGLGDVDLGLRYKLLDSAKAGIVSAQLLVKMPGAYDKNDPLPLGNAQYDTELRMLYGRSLYPWVPGYANLEFGYRWRAGDPSDEIRYLVEFGFDITKSIFTRAKLDGIFSVDNGRKMDVSGNPAATNNFDLGKLEVTLGYQITSALGLEASYRPDIYGQNTAAGANYSLGLYYKTP
jgi:protein XagA